MYNRCTKTSKESVFVDVGGRGVGRTGKGWEKKAEGKFEMKVCVAILLFPRCFVVLKF